MSASPAVLRSPAAAERSRRRRRSVDRFGDGLLYGICAAASVLSATLILLIGYKVVSGAGPAISHFGLGFLTSSTWQPNFDQLGAAPLLFGTAVTSLVALALATPIGISIGLFLTLLAPSGISRVISPLVEMLAAIPSVILGFWGLIILAPFVQSNIEPWLHDVIGFVPIFGTPQTTGSSVFTASLILTIMVVPIVASISRDLFMAVPRDLQDGATALGATRWEMVRGIVLPSTASGIAAAACLGLGRALGEAIAVSQVIGAGSVINASLFTTGDTLAARIANQFQSATSDLHVAALFYLGVILLVIGLIANLFAQWIGKRFSFHQAGK